MKTSESSSVKVKKTENPQKPQSKKVDLAKEFSIEDIWTTGCALNTTGKVG
jgi:hypothetical protein